MDRQANAQALTTRSGPFQLGVNSEEKQTDKVEVPCISAIKNSKERLLQELRLLFSEKSTSMQTDQYAKCLVLIAPNSEEQKDSDFMAKLSSDEEISGVCGSQQSDSGYVSSNESETASGDVTMYNGNIPRVPATFSVVDETQNALSTGNGSYIRHYVCPAILGMVPDKFNSAMII